jgi:hypothetical protein
MAGQQACERHWLCRLTFLLSRDACVYSHLLCRLAKMGEQQASLEPAEQEVKGTPGPHSALSQGVH